MGDSNFKKAFYKASAPKGNFYTDVNVYFKPAATIKEMRALGKIRIVEGPMGDVLSIRNARRSRNAVVEYVLSDDKFNLDKKKLQDFVKQAKENPNVNAVVIFGRDDVEHVMLQREGFTPDEVHNFRSGKYTLELVYG